MLHKIVIYFMKCPCGLAYVGKTQRALKSRIAEHRSDIRTQGDSLTLDLLVHVKSHR